ncbi:hypothetical protein HN011_008292 [Eciton burchellii]|nr:hypothetical protein HN011_008292 [Eciton burchellii]
MTSTLLLLLPLLAICHALPAALNPRIVGGRNAKPGEIPYQVSLQTISSRHHFCGGVILNKNYILTAAHCVSGKNVSLISATVGTTDLRRPHKTYLIKNAYVHEKYNRSNSWINDIALLKIQNEFNFTSLVGPILLPKQNLAIKPGAKAVVSGYGRLWHNGNRTTELNVASIRITSDKYCRSMYKKHSKNIFPTHICANEPFVEKGSCKGDSGGPLTVNGRLIGLVSWSYRCADTKYPSVYTRVPAYVNWIKKHAF